MVTGTLYGLGEFLSGTGMQALQRNVKVKKHSIAIVPNFLDGGGIYFWICTKLYIRPLITIIRLLVEYWRNKETKKAVGQVLDCLHGRKKGS